MAHFGCPTVSIIDDDDAVLDSMCVLLQSWHFGVDPFNSAASFLQARPSVPPACIVLDLHMPGMSGIELLETLRHDGDMTPVVIFTGRSAPGLAGDTAALGAFAVLEKPVSDKELLFTIERAINSQV